MATTFNHIQPHGSSNSWPRGKKLRMPLIISMPSVLRKCRHSRMILNIFFITIFISNLSRSLLFSTSSSLYLPNINLSHWNWLWKTHKVQHKLLLLNKLNLLRVPPERNLFPNWLGEEPLRRFSPKFALFHVLAEEICIVQNHLQNF